MAFTTDSLISTDLTASSLIGSDSGKKLVTTTSLPNGTTAATQTGGDSSTKVATTAYVDSAVGGEGFFDRNGTIVYLQNSGDNLSTKNGSMLASRFVMPPYPDATWYALWTSTLTPSYAVGLYDITSVGAAISGGFLDLAHDDLRYVQPSAPENVDIKQCGTFKFQVKPNYSAAPATDQYFFSSFTTVSSLNNLIQLLHKNTTGTIGLMIYSDSGVSIINTNLGTWSPSSGTTYEFELNYDIDGGATRLFIDGVQSGTTQTNTGYRIIPTKFNVGTDYTQAATSNFSIKQFVVYNAVQHTANYTPGYTLPNFFLDINTTYNYLLGTYYFLKDNVGTSTESITISPQASYNSYITLGTRGQLNSSSFSIYKAVTSNSSYMNLYNNTTTTGVGPTIDFRAKNSSAVEALFSQINFINVGGASGSEQGGVTVKTMTAGTLTDTITASNGTVALRQEAWSSVISPPTGWTTYSASYDSEARYFKDSNGRVHFKGLWKKTATGGYTTFITLPAGYRPYGTDTVLFIIGNYAIGINPSTGVMSGYCYTAGDPCCLNQISFSTHSTT